MKFTKLSNATEGDTPPEMASLPPDEIISRLTRDNVKLQSRVHELEFGTTDYWYSIAQQLLREKEEAE